MALSSDRLERDAEALPSHIRYVLSEHAEDLEAMEARGLLTLSSEARTLCAYFVANRIDVSDEDIPW